MLIKSLVVYAIHHGLWVMDRGINLCWSGLDLIAHYVSYTCGFSKSYLSEYVYACDMLLGRCPSGFDRGNAVESNALNCFNVTIPNSGSRTRAGQGALCYIECSRQGLCDYKTGMMYD